jgi:hypothetical protein
MGGGDFQVFIFPALDREASPGSGSSYYIQTVSAPVAINNNNNNDNNNNNNNNNNNDMMRALSDSDGLRIQALL